MRKSVHKAKENGYIVTEDGKIEHREVYKRECGKIPNGWVIHHLNEDKKDNRIENLIALPSSLHSHVHRLQRKYRCRFNKQELQAIVQKVREEERDIQNEIKRLNKEIKALTGRRGCLGFGDLDRAVVVVSERSRTEDPLPAPIPLRASIPIKEMVVVLRKGAEL